MDPAFLIALLGQAATDEAVEAVLRRFEIRRRPRIEIDEEDPDGPVVDPRDWVINSRAGIEFGFEDEASFCGYDAIEGGLGPLLLTQVYLYGEHEGVDPYQGPLPFGLRTSDSRDTVRRKMQALERSRRSYSRDVWELPECRMTVSYVDDGARIGFVLLWSRQNPFPRLDPPGPLPDIQEMIACLSKGMRDTIVRSTFQGFSFRRQEDRDLFVCVNYREEYGFELRFIDRRGLVHVVFYRERQLGARRWQGTLPHALSLNDSPDVLFEKMKQAPNELTDDQFSGVALWDLGNYCLRVNYSTMKNYLLTVELLAPGTLELYAA